MVPDPGVLYREHATAVWRYARARVPTDADAEDVTSEVFARAIRSAHTYDEDKGSEGAWVVGIARNAVADFWRRRKPEDPVEAPVRSATTTGDTGSPDSTHDDPGDRMGELDVLRDALAALSDREREAVALRFGAELSSSDIGAQLGISPTAARMLVHRAVTKLREVGARG